MMTYRVSHTVEKRIERITYTPNYPRFATPIVFQHGMWHGAWCWEPWQKLLAEWGWESHAHSLPGHGGSLVQRPIRWCTLQYYYAFLNDEIQRQERPPVLIGHSMGGALTQWHLKYGSPLPAAVLVASWPHDTMVQRDIFWNIWRLDRWVFLRNLLALSATPMIRTPRHAAALFLTAGALLSPEELHARLGPESAWVLMQHQPPFWYPPHPETIRTPLLCVAGGADAAFPEIIERRLATYYGADSTVAEGAGHDVMLERFSAETARRIHNWLAMRVP